MRYYTIIIAIFLLSGCRNSKAVFDYDQQADFSSYHSIGFYPEIQSGLSELDERRLRESLVRGFERAGLEQHPEPDLLIDIYSESILIPARSSVGIGIGSGSPNVGVGVSGQIPVGSPKTKTRVTLNLLEADSRSLIWQGSMEVRLNDGQSPKERQKILDDLVEELLQAYPPQ